jgi:energy-coupling factor transporter transmembrane protein EcfT
MYALSLRFTYALALLTLCAFVLFYLPYVLVGFVVLLSTLAILALVGWFFFKRKYGAMLKMSMNPQDFMQNPPRSQDTFAQTGFETDAEGPVIQVKAKEVK